MNQNAETVAAETAIQGVRFMNQCQKCGEANKRERSPFCDDCTQSIIERLEQETPEFTPAKEICLERAIELLNVLKNELYDRPFAPKEEWF